MKKTLLFLILLGPLYLTTEAQKGGNGLNLAVEVGFPTGDFSNYNTGFGLLGKGYLGVGDHAQVSFTTGYSIFSEKDPPVNTSTKVSIVPFLLGYKYNWSLLYIHPQLGYAIYNTKVKVQENGVENKTKDSNGGFTLAAGAGVRLKAFDVGLRYQAGFPSGGTISYIGFHAGYDFFYK
jgi:hypothetical protein